MTTHADLRSRLADAVGDTTAPPGFTRDVLAAGRSRRRRRRLGATGLLVTAIVAGGVVLGRPLGLAASDPPVASAGSVDADLGLRWARRLPAGDDPALPFFGEGGLWDAGRRVPVPDTVDRTFAPQAVAGGWLVMLGDDERTLAPGVLAADGSVRELPAYTVADGSGGARVEVSADGRRVAYGTWVVDVETTDVAEVPHQPEAAQDDGYVTTVRMIGFTDDGLVYEGAPFDHGLGTLWLVRDDGSSIEVDPPAGTHVPDGSPADVAMGYEYASDRSDTCISAHRLVAERWVAQGTGCIGGYLGEALAVSPSGRWLLTDDLPRVWDLREGRWTEVDLPRDVVRSWGDDWLGRAVWENDDAILVPVADRRTGSPTPGEPFLQTTQVVRCTISTGECDRAGDEQRVRVTSSMWGSTEVHFATP